jgi:hypothetical protein
LTISLERISLRSIRHVYSARGHQVNPSLISSTRAVAVVCCALAVASCATSGRSTAAFCGTFAEQEALLAQKYEARTSDIESQTDPLLGFGLATSSIFEAQGDAIVLLDRLEAVAPSEIQPDVEFVRDSLRQSASASQSSILGALVQAFAGNARMAGASQRVDDFIRINCAR